MCIHITKKPLTAIKRALMLIDTAVDLLWVFAGRVYYYSLYLRPKAATSLRLSAS